MDRPKTELAYRVPASKFTRRKLDNRTKPQKYLRAWTQPSIGRIHGDNAYDGEKLKLLVHDERVNGKDQTTSSTTGGLLKQH